MLRYPWFDLTSQIWSILSITLGTFFLLFYLITVIQLCLLLYYKHRFPSYHATVLQLGSLFTGFRVVYFGQGILLPVTEQWVNSIEEILCWFPLNLQYTIVSTLFVYYCKVIYGRLWQGKETLFFTIWGVTNATYLAVTIVWFFLVGDSISGENYIVAMRYAMVFIPDSLVVICLIIFTYVVGKTVSSYPLTQGRNPWARAKVLNMVLIGSSIYRIILYFLMSLYLFGNVFNGTGPGFNRTLFELLRFSNYIVCEIIPVFAILYFLRQVPGAGTPNVNRPSKFAFLKDPSNVQENVYHAIATSNIQQSLFPYNSYDESSEAARSPKFGDIYERVLPENSSDMQNAENEQEGMNRNDSQDFFEQSKVSSSSKGHGTGSQGSKNQKMFLTFGSDNSDFEENPIGNYGSKQNMQGSSWKNKFKKQGLDYANL